MVTKHLDKPKPLAYSRVSSPGSAMPNKQVVDRVKKAPKGSHMALFYNSQKEKQQILFPFIKHGLETGEAIIYLSDERSPRQITKDVSTFGIDVDKHKKTGALRILNGEEWYVQNGTIHKELVLRKWVKAFSDAAKNGFCGLRVSGEPTYFFRHNILEPWMEYERSLPKRFDFAITAICRYRTRDLASSNMNYLLELIKIHSHSITPASIQSVNFHNLYLESINNTLRHILGESGTQVVYYYLDKKFKLPQNSIGDKMTLFNEALDKLFGPGAIILEKEILMDVCYKLHLSCNPKSEQLRTSFSRKMEANS